MRYIRLERTLRADTSSEHIERTPRATFVRQNWYLHSFQTDKNISSLEQFGQILCAQEQLIQGEKIIQLAQKIEDEYTLSKEDEQLINIILGTGSTFQIT